MLYTQLDDTNVDTCIEEQIHYFESITRDFEWKVYLHDTPPDLKDRLRARGFELEEQEPILALDLNNAPESLLLPVTHDIRRITDPTKVEDPVAVESVV